MAIRSLKAFAASLAVVVALFVAAVPASAKPGNGRGGSKGSTPPPTYDWCPPGYTCFVVGL
jgi:hypothetical protein